MADAKRMNDSPGDQYKIMKDSFNGLLKVMDAIGERDLKKAIAKSELALSQYEIFVTYYAAIIGVEPITIEYDKAAGDVFKGLEMEREKEGSSKGQTIGIEGLIGENNQLVAPQELTSEDQAKIGEYSAVGRNEE